MNQELTPEQVKQRQEQARLDRYAIVPMIVLIKKQLDIIAENLDKLSDEDCEELLQDLKKTILL